MSAIQKRETTDLIETLTSAEWPRQVIEVLRQQCAPKGIPDADFYTFVRKCQQTGLNPLVGEAFCIPRNNKGPDGKTVTVYTFQPSAEGMRARAGRFPDFSKVDGAAVCEADPVALIDEGTGEVQHKINAAKPRGRLTGAWGRVVKKDGTAVVVWLPVGSRNGNSSFWNADPGGMLAKAAMVAALRQAYPVAFAGVYAREEMPDEAQTQSVAETVLARASGEATATPPVAEVLPPAAGPLVEFGEWKGRPLSGLAISEAEEALAFAAKQIEEKPKAKWVPKLREQVDAIQKHRDFLAACVESAQPEDAKLDDLFASPPEPGSDG